MNKVRALIKLCCSVTLAASASLPVSGFAQDSAIAITESPRVDGPVNRIITDTDVLASTLPSLSAIHVSRHEPSGIETQRASIELSPQGLRVRRTRPGERHQEILQNFVTNEGWLIDHARSIAHQLPLEDEDGDVGIRPGDSESFLGQQPCGELLLPEDVGKGIWRGRNVQAWHCLNAEGDNIRIEFIDEIYRIVVYTRTVDGRVEELTNLRDRVFSPEHFRPGKRLRLAGRQEFFIGAPEISRYEQAE